MPAEAEAVRAAVRQLVIAERASPDSEHTQASLYHLIARGSVSRYFAAAAVFQSPDVTVSGPWPPFAFAPDPWR